jgi:hypothetical protein
MPQLSLWKQIRLGGYLCKPDALSVLEATFCILLSPCYKPLSRISYNSRQIAGENGSGC